MRPFNLVLITLIYFLICNSSTVFGQDQKYGYVQVLTNIDEFLVVFDDDDLTYQKAQNGETFRLTKGEHSIRIISKNINDWSSTFLISPEDTNTVAIDFGNFMKQPTRSSYFAITTGKNLILNAEEGTQVHLNDEEIYALPFEQFLPKDTYSIRLIHEDNSKQIVNVPVDQYSQTVVNSYYGNRSKMIKPLYSIPGLGYIHNKKYGKATLSLLSLSYFTYRTFVHVHDYNGANDSYDKYSLYYQNASTSVDAVSYRLLADKEIENMRQIRKKGIITGLSLLAIYSVSIFDSYRYNGEGYYKIEITNRTSPLDVPLFSVTRNFKH